MKKLISLTIASGLALALTGCGQPTASDVAKLDVKKVCDVNTLGAAKVLATAKMYNPIAVKGNYEFMRFHVKTSGYISAVEKALKSGSKTTHLIGKKKKVQKIDTKFAAQRACTFAIRAVQEHVSAKSTWRMSVPGDGFKY